MHINLDIFYEINLILNNKDKEFSQMVIFFFNIQNNFGPNN